MCQKPVTSQWDIKIDAVTCLNVKLSVYGQPLDYVIDNGFIDLTYRIDRPPSKRKIISSHKLDFTTLTKLCILSFTYS